MQYWVLSEHLLLPRSSNFSPLLFLLTSYAHPAPNQDLCTNNIFKFKASNSKIMSIYSVKTHCDSGGTFDVDERLEVRSCRVDGPVQTKACAVDAQGSRSGIEHLSLEIDLDKGGGGDLWVQHAIGHQQEVFIILAYPCLKHKHTSLSSTYDTRSAHDEKACIKGRSMKSSLCTFDFKIKFLGFLAT